VEVCLDPPREEGAEIGELGVAAGVALSRRTHELVARALGEDYHALGLALQHPLDVREDAKPALQLDGHLGHQAQVDLAARKRGVGRDEASVPPHQLDL
jgi:hypothetical protein